MKLTRSSGILLHPTSLPGKYGIGEFGPEAVRWLDFLSTTGQRLWQTLPLNPTGYGNSPYQCYSAFAGNPLLTSLDSLLEAGLLKPTDLKKAPDFPKAAVNYDAASRFKMSMLRRAHKRFKPPAGFETFCREHAGWLNDYALFMALKDSHDGGVWNTWGAELAARRPEALASARRELARDVDFYKFVQYLFFRHYGAVKREASSRGISIVGDMPIFVAHDSVDVWVYPEFFYLDADGNPTVVAGVPPDYFSATGQLWGNPLYRWDALEADGYNWWLHRMRMALTLYDIVRIDHFRGFESYWEIPAGEKTAIRGRWVPGPRAKFFHVIRERLGALPIIAEDLGIITPEVEALRDMFGLPGMRVLQFAFSDPNSAYLPHHYIPNCIVYTGTHDNDTTCGWWATATEFERAFARHYIGADGTDIAWNLIHLALRSVADVAIIPLQDVLSLGSEARMNRPGTEEGNWTWRYDPASLTPEVTARLRELTRGYGR